MTDIVGCIEIGYSVRLQVLCEANRIGLNLSKMEVSLS